MSQPLGFPSRFLNQFWKRAGASTPTFLQIPSHFSGPRALPSEAWQSPTSSLVPTYRVPLCSCPSLPRRCKCPPLAVGPKGAGGGPLAVLGGGPPRELSHGCESPGPSLQRHSQDCPRRTSAPALTGGFGAMSDVPASQSQARVHWRVSSARSLMLQMRRASPGNGLHHSSLGGSRRGREKTWAKRRQCPTDRFPSHTSFPVVKIRSQKATWDILAPAQR